MAETENRAKQDIGQDEAYTVNLKETVADEKDYRGRSRGYFDHGMQSILAARDALLTNFVTSTNAINQQIVRQVEQGATTSGKNAENTIGVNETDYAARDIINSPWAEALKAIMTAAVAEAQKPKTE